MKRGSGFHYVGCFVSFLWRIQVYSRTNNSRNLKVVWTDRLRDVEKTGETLAGVTVKIEATSK